MNTLILAQVTSPKRTPPPEKAASVIQIGTIQAFLAVAAVLVGIGIGWGTLRTLIREIKNVLDKEIKPDLKNVRERFAVVEDRVKVLWKDEVAPAHSPRRLNERGNNILNGSGIKEVIEEKKNDFLAILKAKELQNPYDAEQLTLQVVNDLKNDTAIVEKLKIGAFSVGADIDTVLLVGGIYLRNLIFPDLGFSVEDLDKPKTP